MAVDIAFDALYQRLRGQRLAVIATPAGYIRGKGACADLLAACPDLDIRGFLALEHGLRGDLQDGVHFDRYCDGRTGKPVYSFYAQHGHSFPAAFLTEIDTVVFHAQDVSHRAYTYKQALATTLERIAGTATRLVVLDRPSPLAHLGVWGPLQAQFFPLPLPMGIALTLGELARLLVAQHQLDVELEVLACANWRRQQLWRHTSLPWIPPSPNLPHLDSAYAYACTGLLQATSVAEGRGTCKPFEYFGAPFINAPALVHRLNQANLPGLQWREVYFQPAFNKFAGEVCAGAHLLISSAARVQPLRTSLTLLRILADLHPEQFQPLPGLPQWLDGVVRTSADWATLDSDQFLHDAHRQCRAFADLAAPCLLTPYGPVRVS